VLTKPTYGRVPAHGDEHTAYAAPTGTTLSRTVPIDKLNTLRTGTDKQLKGMWGLGEHSPEVISQQAATNAERRMVKTLVPESKPFFETAHDALNLQQALTRSSINEANAAPLNIYQVLAALKGDPRAILGTTLLRRSALNPIGRGMYAVGTNPLLDSLPNAIRAALLTRLEPQK
jgi:hypothetical protein